MIHVRFDGRSLDVEERDVGVAADMPDAAIKRALAGHLDALESRLDDHVVDRPKTGDLIVRPQAVYG